MIPIISWSTIFTALFLINSFISSSPLTAFFAYFFTSSFNVESPDEIFEAVTEFCEKFNLRHVIAETNMAVWNLPTVISTVSARNATAAKKETETSVELRSPGEYTTTNFTKEHNAAKPRLIPAIGFHFLKHKGKWFLLQRKRPSSSNNTTTQDVFTIQCFGKSIQPIHEFLSDAKKDYFLARETKIRIWAPADNIFKSTKLWARVMERPCRQMDTIFLEKVVQEDLLNDLETFFGDDSRPRYLRMGIPYRRGYLFHGKHGTGKSSLVTAIATQFGLPIYHLNRLNDVDIASHMSSVADRCIVLLEDFNPEGLCDRSGDDKDNKRQLTLSSFLNALDGTSAHEGHILIITTNKPETFGPVFRRPGRIDYEVSFGNATKAQAKKLFQNVFNGKQELAERFSQLVNPDSLTVADLQGFLLKRKDDVNKAVGDFPAWAEMECRIVGRDLNRRFPHTTVT